MVPTYMVLGLTTAFLRLPVVQPPLLHPMFSMRLVTRLAAVSLAFLAGMYILVRIFHSRRLRKHEQQAQVREHDLELLGHGRGSAGRFCAGSFPDPPSGGDNIRALDLHRFANQLLRSCGDGGRGRSAGTLLFIGQTIKARFFRPCVPDSIC